MKRKTNFSLLKNDPENYEQFNKFESRIITLIRKFNNKTLSRNRFERISNITITIIFNVYFRV